MRRVIISFLLAGTAVLIGSAAVSTVELYASDQPPSSPSELLASLLPDAPWVDEPSDDYQASSAVLAHIESMQLTPAGEQLFLSTRPTILANPDFNDACSEVTLEEGVGLLGCYYPANNRIYLYDVTDQRLKNIEPAVAAHELLHAAWETLSPAMQIQLEEELLDFVGSLPADHPVLQRLESYSNASTAEIAAELHSIVGTEAVNITVSLERHYAEYFANRRALAADALEAYSIFTQTRLETQQLLEEVQIMEVQIDVARNELQQAQGQLELDIEAFNMWTEAGGFATEADYNQARSDLELRSARLEKATEDFNRIVDEFNTKLELLRDYNVMLEELNEGVNIPDKA